jgi:hypothetical protein
MRDYDDYGEYVDDSIRLHTPILQRVLILAAVIISVPVVMWTITAFVRSYVARPKAPVIQVASTENPAAARLGSQTSATAPPAANQPASPPRADIPARPSGDASLASAPVAAVNSPPPAGVQSISTQSPLAPLAGRPGAVGADTTASSAAARGPTDTASAIPMPAPALRTADNAPTAALPGDRGLAWPNPNSSSPPSFGSAITPAPPPALPRAAATETLPRSEPIQGSIQGSIQGLIKGPIPLPRHRPAGTAMGTAMSTAMGTTAGAAMASSGPASGASGGRVPLPRGRPTGAPAETSQPLTNPGGYEPGLSAGGG